MSVSSVGEKGRAQWNQEVGVRRVGVRTVGAQPRKSGGSKTPRARNLSGDQPLSVEHWAAGGAGCGLVDPVCAICCPLV